MTSSIPRLTRVRNRGRRGSILIASVILVVVAGVIALSWLGFVTHSMQASVRDRERLASLYAAEAGIDVVVNWFNNPEMFQDFLAQTSSVKTESGQDLVRIVPTKFVRFNGTSAQDREEKSLSTWESYNQWANPHPVRYTLAIPQVRQSYSYATFEPYVRDYLKDFDGVPLSSSAVKIWNTTSNQWISPHNADSLVPTKYTYFLPGMTNDLFSIKLTDASERSKVPSMVIAFDDALEPADVRAIMPHREFNFDRHGMNTDEAGISFARIESIELIHPTQFTLPPALRVGVITKIVATGISRSGIRTTVECLMTENRVPNISSPGAIIAPSGVKFSGNVNVHWGEIWTREDQILDNNWTNHFPRYQEGNYDFGKRSGSGVPNLGGNPTWDPWFRYRTEGVFKDQSNTLFADGQIIANGGYSPIPIPSIIANWFQRPYYNAGIQALQGQGANQFKRDFGYFDNMLQNQTLDIMTRDYSDWKELFQDFNLPYYFTDESGKIWGRERDSTKQNYGELVGKTYQEWFDVTPTDPNYWEFEYLFAFIDSVPRDENGNAGPAGVINDKYKPRDPTREPAKSWADSGMATIRDAGRGTHTRGVIFAAASIDYKGQGSPPFWDTLKFDDGTYMVQMPNGTTPADLNNKQDAKINIAHNGLIHSWGRIWNTGNRTIYGSIHADDGFWLDDTDTNSGNYKSNGTPNVYYNFRMADGSWLELNQSRVRREFWDIVAINRIDGGS